MTTESPRVNLSALYICYFGLREPLVQTQVLPYLRQLASAGYGMHLLTFERIPVSHWAEAQKAAWHEQLAEDGITWHSLTYHQRPSLPATLYDILHGAYVATRLVRRFGIQLLHARSHVAAAMAARVKQRTGAKLLFDIRGFFPEEYVDGGRWKSGGLLYKLTKRTEHKLMKQADGFVVLTQQAKEILFSNCNGADEQGRPVAVIPCCVDIDQYSIPQSAIQGYRKERGWGDRPVLVYVGSIGTWYLWEEMLRFATVARDVIPGLYFQVLTQRDTEIVTQQLRDSGWSADDSDVRSVLPADLPRILSACDAGLSFIKPCFSKRASSPTKLGEYLASGLPVVANAGIGDCDELLLRLGLETLIRHFNDHEYRRVAVKLSDVLKKDTIGERCRGIARDQLSLQNVGGPRYRALYQLVQPKSRNVCCPKHIAKKAAVTRVVS